MVLAVGCGGDDTAAATASTTGDATSTTAQPTTSTTMPTGSQTANATGSGDGSTGPGPATSDASGDTTSASDGGSSTGGGPEVPADCKSLLAAQPDTPSGEYVLNVGGDPAAATFTAYCDMDTDGGGWTLVGRSAAGSYPSDFEFGWDTPTGTVADERMPYALGAKGAGLRFEEIAVGTHVGGNAWGDNVYVLAVPLDFLIIYEKAPYEVVPQTLVGTCAPAGGPTELRWVGWTDFPTLFPIGPDPDETFDGLEPASFDANVADCDAGGLLHMQQAMVMVR